MTQDDIPSENKGIIPIPDKEITDHHRLITIGDYILHGWLGGGSFSSVYLAEESKTGRRLALKVAQPRGEEHLLREAKILSRTSHENIVKLLGTVRVNGRFALEMEALRGENLRSFLHPWRLRKAGTLPAWKRMLIGRRICGQLCRPLSYLHGQGIVHGDLKPENINVLFRDGYPASVKILDLGLSTERAGGALGTPFYIAPEALEGKMSFASDIWSLGVIFYELLMGETPCEKYLADGSFSFEAVRSFLEQVRDSGMPSHLFGKMDPAGEERCSGCALAPGCGNAGFGSFHFCGASNPLMEQRHLLWDFYISLLRDRILNPQPEERPDLSEIQDLFIGLEREKVRKIWSPMGNIRPTGWITGGLYSVLLRAEELDSGKEVCLILPASFEHVDCIRQEARILARSRHRGLPRLVSIKQDLGLPFLVLEKESGPTLLERIRNQELLVQETLSIAIELGEILSHLVSHCRVHAHLQPGIVLAKRESGFLKMKLVEVQDTPGEEDERFPGLLYKAPEDSASSRSTASLVWNLGTVLFEMLTGATPLEGLFPPGYLRRIQEDTKGAAARLRLLKGKLTRLKKRADRLPAALFYEEILASCDRCRDLYWEKGKVPPSGGILCDGRRCLRGDYRVMRFRLPIPLALFLRSAVFLFNPRKRISMSRFLLRLRKFLEFAPEEMEKLVWIPALTRFLLEHLRAPNFMKKRARRRPGGRHGIPDLTRIPMTCSHICAYLVEGHRHLRDLYGGVCANDAILRRYRKAPGYQEGGDFTFPGGKEELKKVLSLGHLALARQLFASGQLKAALEEYEESLELHEENRESLEEAVLLSAHLNLIERARYYFRRLKDLGHHTHLGALFCYLEGKTKERRERRATQAEAEAGRYFWRRRTKGSCTPR